MLSLNKNKIPDSRLANKAELAEFFGSEISTVHNWVRKGCPFISKGSRGISWEFDILEVAKWKFGGGEEKSVDNPEDMPAKERLDYYKGCRERDTYRREIGELIEASEVAKTWSGIIQTAKGRLMALPARIAPEVIGLEEMRDIEDKIRDEVISVLEELASGEEEEEQELAGEDGEELADVEDENVD